MMPRAYSLDLRHRLTQAVEALADHTARAHKSPTRSRQPWWQPRPTWPKRSPRHVSHSSRLYHHRYGAASRAGQAGSTKPKYRVDGWSNWRRSPLSGS